jgi:hypothetical protein
MYWRESGWFHVAVQYHEMFTHDCSFDSSVSVSVCFHSPYCTLAALDSPSSFCDQQSQVCPDYKMVVITYKIHLPLFLSVSKYNSTKPQSFCPSIVQHSSGLPRNCLEVSMESVSAFTTHLMYLEVFEFSFLKRGTSELWHCPLTLASLTWISKGWTNHITSFLVLLLTALTSYWVKIG